MNSVGPLLLLTTGPLFPVLRVYFEFSSLLTDSAWPKQRPFCKKSELKIIFKVEIDQIPRTMTSRTRIWPLSLMFVERQGKMKSEAKQRTKRFAGLETRKHHLK